MILNVVYQNIFWIRFAGMGGLEEYAEERYLLNEKNNYGKEPIKEDITNNSSELLQIVKDLKTKWTLLKNKMRKS